MSDTRITANKRALAAIAKFESEMMVRHVGAMLVTLPSPPKNPKDIANYGLPAHKQKFQYTEQPKKREEPTDEFIAQEVKRLKEGYWFFNNDNLEYLTGYHYTFLNYWKDRGKTLVFIDSQRDAFHWWDAIEKDKNMAFGVLVSNRRFGKTVWGTFIAYIRTATKPFQYAGIQSKTNPDAKGVFNKLVASWSKLPEWFKPVDVGVTRPASVLEFFEPSKRSGKDKKAYGDALDSKIDFKASGASAYDGEELDTYFGDEEGKTVDANVMERHEVVTKCLMKGPTIRGKGLKTTTVEEMEKKGGKNFKLIWDACDAKKINPKTGRNPGLGTTLFIPADYGYYGQHPVTDEWFVDEFGYSRRELATQYILDSWEGLEGNALSSAQRKDPLTLKHVWQLKNFGSAFDNELLEIQKDWLEEPAQKNLIRRVTLEQNGDGPVIMRDDPKGKFQICWNFKNPAEEANKRTHNHDSGLYEPANCDNFAIGVDPFAATIVSGKGSMGVAYAYMKVNPADPENSGFAVMRYAERTKTKGAFHRNVMMMAKYYGCKANYENDVDDYYETFINAGFKNYVMWRPKCTIDPQRKGKTNAKYGTPAKDPFALMAHFNITNDYIQARYSKIYFIELVLDLIDYDPNERTIYDDTVAFGQSLIGGLDNTGTEKKKPKYVQLLRGAKRVA